MQKEAALREKLADEEESRRRARLHRLLGLAPVERSLVNCGQVIARNEAAHLEAEALQGLVLPAACTLEVCNHQYGNMASHTQTMPSFWLAAEKNTVGRHLAWHGYLV